MENWVVEVGMSILARSILIGVLGINLLACDARAIRNLDAASDTPVTYDMNQDGEDDILYHDESNGYYEQRDLNFDGNVDESIFYTFEGVPQFGRSDSNYDGLVDTAMEFKNGYLSRAFVDSNDNQLFDIAYYYDDGLNKARRFYPADSEASQARVGEIRFDEYGYPRSEVRNPTPMTEQEFHDELEPKVLLDR